MSAKDFIKKYGTPEKEILTSTDSAQLVVVPAGLHEHNYIVQNECYLSQGLNLQVGFSMRFDGLKEPKSSQKAKTLFRGDEPEFMCVTIKRNFPDDMKMIRLLVSFLPAWRSLDVVLLEAIDAPLGEGAQALIRDLGMNPLKVLRSERSVCSMGMGTEFFPPLATRRRFNIGGPQPLLIPNLRRTADLQLGQMGIDPRLRTVPSPPPLREPQ